jgi:hypothetical protein
MTTPLITDPNYKFPNPNLTVSGSVSTGNLGMFRNRIINGDMRVDQRGSDGSTATGPFTDSYLTYKVPPTSYYTTDRFAIAAPNIGNPVAIKVPLSDTDTNITGGFITATSIGLVPTDSLMAYFTFESNLSDLSGNGVTLTSSLTPQYVPSAVIGAQALYLPNEANVSAGTAAANRITCPNFVFPSKFTVSMWVMNRGTGSAIAAVDNTIFITNTGTGVLTNSLGIFYLANSGQFRFAFYNANYVDMLTPVLFEWSHVAFTYNNGTAICYINGVSYTPITGTLAQNGFMLGNAGTTHTQTFAGYIDDFRIYNRVLGASEISALAKNIGIPMAPPVDASCITRITLDNTVEDVRGGLPTPARRGNIVFTPVCKTGSFAMDLTANNAGGTDVSTATTALTYTLASGSYTVPITVMGWFNTKVTNSIQVMFSIGNNSSVNNTSLQIFINSGRVQFEIYNGATTNIYILPSITINAGTWYHVALSASETSTNSGIVNYYLNGLLVGSRTTASGLGIVLGTGTPNQLRIGAQNGTNIGYNFQGFIDDVRIYNRALTSRDIAGIYNASQYASYTLFKQPIEATNFNDLGWGTNVAQPVTTSMWIKNNTSNAQSFSVSLQNAGANLIAWLPFENGTTDVLGFLNNSSNYNAPLSTSVYKVGTASLDLSANTAGGSLLTSKRIDYNVPFPLQTPLTVSCWIYSISPTAGVYQIPWSLGSYTSGWVFQLVVNTSGQLYVDLGINNVLSATTASTTTAISANTWYHVCVTLGNGTTTLYMNGKNVASVSYTVTGIIYITNKGLINNLCIGSLSTTSFSQAYKGYIDDLRIYNVALSPTSIAQLYANNASTTIPSNFLLPRSVVYNTPSIPANSWQKIAFTIPGETTSSFLPTTDTGMTLAVCLGASDLYNTGNLAASANNSTSVWNTVPDYMGASNQLYAYTDSNFLAYVTNSILITGVQLEKGTITTPFEFRPYGMELRLCQRYYEVVEAGTYGSESAAFNQYASIYYKTIKRVIPVIGYTSLTSIFTSTGTSRIGIRNNGSGVTSISDFTVSAEL